MRKVILYIAVSLDGFIADRQGGVDWLEQASKGEENSGYDEFIQKSILFSWDIRPTIR